LLEEQSMVVGGAEHGCWRCRAWLLEVQSMVVGGAEQGCWRSREWLLEVQSMVVGGAEHGCWRSRERLLEEQSMVVGDAYKISLLVIVNAGVFERNSLDSQTCTLKECAHKGNLQAKFSKHVSNKISATETT